MRRAWIPEKENFLILAKDGDEQIDEIEEVKVRGKRGEGKRGIVLTVLFINSNIHELTSRRCISQEGRDR